MSLPEIFKNKIDENIKNSQYTYYSQSNRNISINKLPVEAVIETKNRIFNTTIIGKTNNYLITNKNEVIYIKDCLNIKYN